VIYCLVCATTGFNNFHVHPLLYVKLPVHHQFIQQVNSVLIGGNTNPQPIPAQAPTQVQTPVQIQKTVAQTETMIVNELPPKPTTPETELKKESSWFGAEPPVTETKPVEQTTGKVFVYPKKHTSWLPKVNEGEYKVQINVDNQSDMKFDKTFCFKRVKGSCNSPSEYVTPIIKPKCEKEFGLNLSMNKIGSKSVWALCKRANDTEAYGGYVVFECMDGGIRLYTIDALKFKSLNC